MDKFIGTGNKKGVARDDGSRELYARYKGSIQDNGTVLEMGWRWLCNILSTINGTNCLLKMVRPVVAVA